MCSLKLTWFCVQPCWLCSQVTVLWKCLQPLSHLNIYVGVAGLVCRSQLKVRFRGEDLLYASVLSFIFCVDCR